jgi:hypothetical protein
MSRNKARINYLSANYTPVRGCLNNLKLSLKYIIKSIKGEELAEIMDAS